MRERSSPRDYSRAPGSASCLSSVSWQTSGSTRLSQEREPYHELHVRDLGCVLLGRVQCLMIRGGANNAEQLQKQMIGSTVDVPESPWTIPVENCLPRNHSPVPESLGPAVLYYFGLVFFFSLCHFLSLEMEMAHYSSTLAWKSNGRRSVLVYSPWCSKESDTTERLHFHFLIKNLVAPPKAKPNYLIILDFEILYKVSPSCFPTYFTETNLHSGRASLCISP